LINQEYPAKSGQMMTGRGVVHFPWIPLLLCGSGHAIGKSIRPNPAKSGQGADGLKSEEKWPAYADADRKW
jgi:hypothetical protein